MFRQWISNLFCSWKFHALYSPDKGLGLVFSTRGILVAVWSRVFVLQWSQ